MINRLAGALLALLLMTGAAQARQASAPAAEAASAVLPAPAATVLPAPVAATRPVPAPAAAAPYSGAAGSLLQTIFALCVVLGLLAVLAWAMKRFGPRATGSSAHVRLVGGLSLGGRERIIVVEVGEQWIVVGASPGRVNALATMPRQGAELTSGAASLAGSDQPTPPASNFGDWLKQTIAKRDGK